jgi:4a-hydroxytetrahydrobiopterin dehydratase
MGYELLTSPQLEDLLTELGPEWTGSVDRIGREFRFDSFDEAMAFANRVADVCRRQDHHLDLHVLRRRVVVELRTNAAGGVTTGDVALARSLP